MANNAAVKSPSKKSPSRHSAYAFFNSIITSGNVIKSFNLNLTSSQEIAHAGSCADGSEGSVRQIRALISEKLSELSQDEILSISLKILSKSSSCRSVHDLFVIKKAFENIPFFKELEQTSGEAIVQQCFKKMTLETFDKNQSIIKQGEVGKKFYIIIKGQVKVFVFTQAYQDRIALQKESNSVNGTPSKQHPAPKQKKAAPHPVLPEFQLEDLQEVNHQRAGSSFGQLALINDRPRMATVCSVEECHLAVLNKEDFKSIIQQAEEKKLKEDIDFISNIVCFSQLKKRSLQLILCSLKQNFYNFRELVYKEGEKATNIYVVKSGEFKIVQTIAANQLCEQDNVLAGYKKDTQFQQYF